MKESHENLRSLYPRLPRHPQGRALPAAGVPAWASGVLALLTPFAGPLFKALAFALALVAAAGWGAWKMHQRDQVAYNALTAEYASFKGGVKGIGDAAKIASEKRKLLDIKAKEYADAKAITDLAAARASVARLRADAAKRDSRGGSVPAAPAGSRCPDGQTCFATTEYQRALGEFDSSARRLADSCSAIEIELNTAREWAQRVKTQ